LGATAAAAQRYFFVMSPFMYRCPDTGFRVPSFASTKTSDGAYEVVSCIICGQVHLVDPATRKVLGQDNDRPAKVLRPAAL
jgi:hypothetical protein